MATSGTIGSLSEPNQSTTTSNGYIDAMIDWSATQSIEGNYSDVTATLKYSRNNTGYTTYGRWTGSITINGTTKTVSSASDRITITYNSNTVAVSNTVRVYHDNDGTKSITISATGKISGTSLESTSISGTVTLTTIPRASAISSLTSSVAINGSNAVSVNISRHSSSFTHTVRFYINSTYTKTISDVGTSTSYVIPTTWLNAMPSSTKCTAHCVVTTYNGSTKIGDAVSKTFTVTVPTNVLPSIGTITLDPVNITTVDGTSRNILVKGKNKLTVSVSGCAAGAGSSIKSYTFSGKNLSSTVSSTSTSASATSGILSSTGSLTYTVKITDARGRTVAKTSTITCYDYDTPAFSSFKAYRCDSSGTADDNGTYIKYSFTVNYSSVNSTNKSTVAIYYKKNTSNTWTAAANALTNSTTQTAAATIKDSSGAAIVFSADSTYAIYATVTDNYKGSTNSSTITVFGASRVLNIRSSGTGISFGKMAEQDNLFECKWPSKFDSTLNATGNITTNGDIGCTEAYSGSNFAVYCQWADGSNHDMLVRSDDGVTMGVGWIGDDTNVTTLDVRPQKVNMRGVMTAPRGIFTATEDVSSTEQNDVPLRIGIANAEHIDIDSNEIVAKDNATTAGTLALSGANVDMYSGTTLTLRVSKDETSEYIKSLPTYNRTYDGSPNMYITSNGVFGRGTSSSQRYKTDINDVIDDKLNPYNILNIPVRQFKYNEDNVPINKNKDDLYIGFIAEEVASAYPIAAEYNDNGQVEMWNIKVIVPAMLKIIQDQQLEIQSLKNTINNIVGTSSKNIE